MLLFFLVQHPMRHIILGGPNKCGLVILRSTALGCRMGSWCLCSGLADTTLYFNHITADAKAKQLSLTPPVPCAQTVFLLALALWIGAKAAEGDRVQLMIERKKKPNSVISKIRTPLI